MASNNEGTESRDTNVVTSLKSHLHSSHRIEAEHLWRCDVCGVVASGIILFAQHKHEGERIATMASPTEVETTAVATARALPDNAQGIYWRTREIRACHGNSGNSSSGPRTICPATISRDKLRLGIWLYT